MAKIQWQAIGLDLSLKHLFSGPDGEQVEAHKFCRDLEPALAATQLASHKTRIKAIHAKLANRRKAQLHKRSTELVRKNQAVFVGNVDASALAQTGMPKSVLDSGWGSLRTMLHHQCDDASVWFKQTDERYSTQDCSTCGARAGTAGRWELAVRRWWYPCCGTQHDRDVNTAVNIRNRGPA